jgi:hypothetical protein
VRRLAPTGAWLALLLASLPTARAEHVTCHVTYGGETQTLTSVPGDNSYTAPDIEIGSYYLFRIVVRNAPSDLASVKLYTYANLPSGRSLVHQATHPWPLDNTSPYGFTGQHFIYEPRYGAELQYWCEVRK